MQKYNSKRRPKIVFDDVCEFYSLPRKNSHFFRFKIDVVCEVASVTKNTANYSEALEKTWENIIPELNYDEIIDQYVYSTKVSGRNFYDYGVEGVRVLELLLELYFSTFLKLELCNDYVDLSALKYKLTNEMNFHIAEDEKDFIRTMFERFFMNSTTLDEQYTKLCRQYYYEIYCLNRILGDELSKRLPLRFGMVVSDVKSILDQLLSDKYGNILDHIWIISQERKQDNIGACLGNLLYVLKNNGVSCYDSDIIGQELIISRKQLGIECFCREPMSCNCSDVLSVGRY